MRLEGHGGELAVGVLTRFGVEEVFTLSGGHVFPVYDACVRAGVRIVDVRHEQTAGFAAEGMAKLNRRPGVAVLTAGPGVTNGVSALTTAHFNGSPLVVLGGRAPKGRWGAGSLQELDHVPIVSSITKRAVTAEETSSIADFVAEVMRASLVPHRGPGFVDLPLDVLFGRGQAELDDADLAPAQGQEADPDELQEASRLLAGAERPVLIAGGDVWWAGAWEALRLLVEELRVPAFVNGLGRGCLAADHELAFSRARPLMKEADVIAVVGTPLDFRLSFGEFPSARVVHVVDDPAGRSTHSKVAVSPAGDLARALEGMACPGARRADHEPWIARLGAEERMRRRAEADQLTSGSRPIHPVRVYGELTRRLDRDAVVVGDGGDFVSFAGRLVESYLPGRWLDPGPYGCLGTGMGYAAAARLAHPDAQVVALLGDGAAGFSLIDVDTLVRHRLPVVMIVGNNGIWGLEKHPMHALYGYDVAADLQPGCRYDEVVRALGGAGETVAEPGDVGPALDRALASEVPYMVNVLTDPAVTYPRSSSLA